MPVTPPVPTPTCPRCGSTVPGDLLQRLGGTCSRCLLAFAAGDDHPDFPNFRILSTLGKGGMGVVYRAEQPSLGRLVALKVLSNKLMDEPQFMERFSREAATMAKLAHPNIVTVHDFGVHGGVPYLVMEHVDGSPLRKLLAGGPLPPDRAIEIALSLCDGLQYAHRRSIVHRDIKPENILIDAEGRVKIADFGLATLAREAAPGGAASDVRVGTPNYMPPEQFTGSRALDHRADLYALGVVLYEMLTGELPIGRFRPPSECAPVDPRLDPVVLRLLEKSPEARYSSALEVRQALEQRRAPGPGRGAKWILPGVAAAGAAILLAGWLARSPQPRPVEPPPSPAPGSAPKPRESDRWTELGGSATEGGLSWTRGSATRPSLCLDRKGRPAVAWRDNTSGQSEIYVRRWDGTAWLELGESAHGGGISRMPGVSREPCLALDPEDRPVVVWFEENRNRFVIYLRRWDGKEWIEQGGSGSGDGISGGVGKAIHPSVAVDAAGYPVVVWYEITKTRGREIYLKRWDGTRWIELGGSATDGGISNTATDSFMPSVVLDARGYPVVAWHEVMSNLNFEVYLRRWDGKAWVEVGGSASGGGVSRNAGKSSTGHLISVRLDADDHPVVVWDDDTPGNREIYLRKWDGTAWVELGGSATGGGVSNTPAASCYPALALDAAGRPVVAWQEELSGRPQVYLRRWDGKAWTEMAGSASGGGISDHPRASTDPMIALDPEGMPVVVWSDSVSGLPQIHLKRFTRPR